MIISVCRMKWRKAVRMSFSEVAAIMALEKPDEIVDRGDVEFVELSGLCLG